jgi:hypothetical protein
VIDRLFAARQSNLDGHQRTAGGLPRKSGVDHELAVAAVDLERGDRAAAVALEEVHDQALEAVSELLDCRAGRSHARNGRCGQASGIRGDPPSVP